MKKGIFILILIGFCACTDRTPCDFKNDYLYDIKSESFPSFKLSSENCREFLLESNFDYQYETFTTSFKLKRKDSIFYNNGEIVFDFSKKREHGILKLNDSISVPIKFLMELSDSNDEKYSLFSLKKVETYDSVFNLDLVLVISYNNGIVGSFYSGKEHNSLIQIKYKGYKPNKKLIDSLFIKVKIL